MEAIDLAAERSFGELHFGECDFGDERLTRFSTLYAEKRNWTLKASLIALIGKFLKSDASQ